LIAVFNYIGCGGNGGSGSSSVDNDHPAPAPHNPSVTTNPATNVTKTFATLNGTVNPGGVNTSAYFQYGKTLNYGNTIGFSNVGSGTSTTNISANLTGLTLNTIYNFRLVANRNGVILYGDNLTFTTVGLPTCVTNPATNITINSAALNGTVNPNGADTTAYFYYGVNLSLHHPPHTADNTLSTASVSAGAGALNITISKVITGLSASTAYDFRIVGDNTNGTSLGNSLTFMTGAPAGAPPACTTDPASNVISDSARLNGMVNPNASATDAYFNYGLTTSYNVTTTAQAIGSGNISVAINTVLTGLSPSTIYNFRVAGTNSNGTGYGNNRTFATMPPPPYCVTNPASNITYNSARLNATINPYGLDTIAQFNYGITSTYTLSTISQAAGNSITDVVISAIANSLHSNTRYNFRCVADNLSGTTYGDNLMFTTAKPPPSCTTDAAGNITFDSAELNGTVNPHGFDTTAYFRYGLTTSYTITTTPQILRTGHGPHLNEEIGNTRINAVINGLSTNTNYNFRCFAANIGGTVQGANRTFGHWSRLTFPTNTGQFTDTISADSNNDVKLALDWLERYPATSTPSARYGHAMAYDSLRHKTVLFGGGWATSYNNDTWEWDGTDWLERYSATITPTARRYPAMVYDSKRNVTVMFGGNTGVANNETWEWDGANWLERYSTTVTPTARYGHAMAYDSSRNVTVLFGGNTGAADNETWEWDGANWLERYPAPVTPTARYYHSMAYDSKHNVIVMFGGENGTVNNNETWEWNGISWTLRTTIGPAARRCHALTYDSNRNMTVLFGGSVAVADNETWEWDGTNWLQRLPASVPAPRYYHAMAYDSNRNATVLFAGSAGDNETWEWGSQYLTDGAYVSESITPPNISSWSILTFTYNAPANTSFAVDILKSSDNSVLLSDIPSGTDLSTYPAMNGITSIKLRAHFATTDISITPTLSDWGVGYSN
jgi:hypothetical protein